MIEPCVKESELAGLFYPADPLKLDHVVNDLLSSWEAIDAIQKFRVCGLIVPHASYNYSGLCAASAYRFIRFEKFDRVIILGPTHRNFFKGVAAINSGAFRTPLGSIQVDEFFFEKLFSSTNLIKHSPDIFSGEHSVEVQLPFLQIALRGNFSVAPILMGKIDGDDLDNFIESLRVSLEELSGRSLIIVSTDFSHFTSLNIAQKKDALAKDCILSGEAETLLMHYRENSVSLCGLAPIYTSMKLFPDLQIQHLDYSHSGLLNTDLGTVVSYMTFVYLNDGL